MRIGIFGDEEDLQCQEIAKAIFERGAQAVLIDANALDEEVPCAFDELASYVGSVRVDGIPSFFLRFIPAPYAPHMEKDGELVLYDDWFTAYMHERERASFYVSLLLNLLESGASMVNPPQAASVLQYKPFQLHAMKNLGIPTPRTLITNDPGRVKAFAREVKEVIFKPLMGGAITRMLDEAALGELALVRRSPVIFQERVHGEDLRVMLVDGSIVSSAAIEVEALDFRDDETYASGRATYHEVKLPARIEAMCRKAASRCGLTFAGIDIKHRGDDWVFLELNSSPVYLDVEHKLGHPITAALADCLVRRGRAKRVRSTGRRVGSGQGSR